MGLRLKEKRVSTITSLAGAAVTLVALVAFCIYGAVYKEYFDLGVLAFLALSIICAAAYALVAHRGVALLNLAAVFFVSFALGLFFLNSYPVWGDWWGNMSMTGSASGSFNMYGSRGGVGPVITIMVLCIIAVVCDIVSCFTQKEAEVL